MNKTYRTIKGQSGVVMGVAAFEVINSNPKFRHFNKIYVAKTETQIPQARAMADKLVAEISAMNCGAATVTELE